MERDPNFERALLRADIRAGNSEAAKAQLARNQKFDPERGWVEATPMKAPRHWPWLQRLVDRFFSARG
jgi:hypothetical protein